MNYVLSKDDFDDDTLDTLTIITSFSVSGLNLTRDEMEINHYNRVWDGNDIDYSKHMSTIEQIT